MVAIIGYSLCHKSKGGLAGLNISTYTMEVRIFMVSFIFALNAESSRKQDL